MSGDVVILRVLGFDPSFEEMCQSARIDPTHPIYILELGAGSGRFAYHFLKKLWDFFPQSTLRHLTIKYVLSDFSESNLRYWRTHPFLQLYFQHGILDIAHFDAQHDLPLHLHLANQTHTTLKNPLIILANYFLGFFA